MGQEYSGATTLISLHLPSPFNNETLQRLDTMPAGRHQYSILYAAEEIRLAGSGPSYRLLLMNSVIPLVEFSVPRSEPVLAHHPRQVADSVKITPFINVRFTPTLPFLTNSSRSLLSIGMEWHENKGVVVPAMGYRVKWTTYGFSDLIYLLMLE